MATPSKRRELDLRKLMMTSYEVHVPDESATHDFWVKFRGPADTPYFGGIWKIHVLLPNDYPYKSPSIGFMNRIFHPNVDERSGSVCLDVINQTWSPMFDLVNVMEVFLPQLLRYPNPADPLNGEAARLLLDSEEKFNCRVREHVAKYASLNFRIDDEDDEGSKPKKLCEDRGVTTPASVALSSTSISPINGKMSIPDDNIPQYKNTETIDGTMVDDDDDNTSDVSDMSDL